MAAQALRRSEDYARDCEAAARAAREDARAAVRRFVRAVLPSYTGLCVSEGELEQALTSVETHAQGGEMDGTAGAVGRVRRSPTDLRRRAAADVDALLSLGALARRLDFEASRSYWFALPGRGGALRALADGRAELAAWLRKKKFKEVSADASPRFSPRASPRAPRGLAR